MRKLLELLYEFKLKSAENKIDMLILHNKNKKIYG